MAFGSLRASPAVLVADCVGEAFCGEGGVSGPCWRASLGGCGGGDFSTYSGEFPRLNGWGFFGFGARRNVMAFRSRSARGAFGGGGFRGVSSTRGCTKTNRGIG